MSEDKEATLLLRIRQAGGDVLDHFVVTLGDVVEGVKKAGEFLYSFVEAYEEQEKAVNALSQTMVQNGIYTTELRQKYEEMASAVQKNTLYGDEQVIAAQATLQAFTGQKEVSEQLIRATTDLATAKKMDLGSAAELVGKALSQENNVLKRQGIQYEETSDKGERMTRVIEAISDKFGGQAQAATQGLGSIKQLQNAFSDFQENVGERLAPVIAMAARALTGFFETFGKGGASMDIFMSVLQAIAQQGIEFARDFEVVGKVIGNVLGGVMGTLASALEGNWKEAWQNAKGIATVSMDDIASANQTMKERLTATDAAFVEGKEGSLAREEALERASLERKGQMHAEFDEARAKKQLEDEVLRQDGIIKQQEMEAMTNDQKLAAQISMLDKKIAAEENYHAKSKMVADRGALIEAQRKAIEDKQKLAQEAYFQNQRSDIIGAASDLIGAIAGKESKAVFYIQKAAALAQAFIATQVASAQAMASIPYPANLAAAANVEIIGYLKMGAIAGSAIQGLATGGIVTASPGGGLYNIGEGGRDEAVIPLDDPSTQERLGGMGGSMTVHFNGPILADEAQAEQFARVIDRALMKLRQSNQSLAFDSDLT